MKLTTKKLKQLVREQLKDMLNEAIRMADRRKAKKYTFSNVEFKVLPFTNALVADLESDGTIKKLVDVGQEHQGFYLIKFDKEAGSSSLHSKLNDINSPLFTNQELKQYYPESSRDQISYIAMIQGPDNENNKAVFDAISNELQLR
jgi:hypothetical protein